MKDGKRGLESLVSTTLRLGVVVSLVIEVIGIGSYVLGGGTLTISFGSEWQTGGRDFFAYAKQVAFSLGQGVNSISLIALGIIVLMITPYIRVVTSVIYFVVENNPKYALISLFVLTVLTISLIAH